MARPFRKHRDSVEMRFDDGEVEVLGQFVADLVRRLGGVDDSETVADPLLRRLFPDGYTDDPKAASELRSLIQNDLRDGKIRSAKVVLETLAALPAGGRLKLDAEQAQAWLGTLNDIRLTLGTALDVTDDTELQPLPGDEANNFVLGSYVFLGWLQECLVESLSS